MAVVYIGLGSNLGNRQENIDSAIALIRKNAVNVEKISTIIETNPVGGPPQGKYLNAVIECQTSLTALQLLTLLQSIEQKLGRVRSVKNGSRTIDLDILLYDKLTISTEELTIPHPRMFEREFVMKPLKEIAPEFFLSPPSPLSFPRKWESSGDKLQRGSKIDSRFRGNDNSMKVVKTIKALRQVINAAKAKGKTIGFVPTMGSFHDGHVSLMRQSKKETDLTVVSIFVNPKQFNRKEDLKNYPRNYRRDKLFALKENVDIIFYPSVDEMYPQGHWTCVDVKEVTKGLCGKFRPGHFKGVATVVAKLINLVTPDVMYLGQKDAQQVVVITKMVQNLNFPVRIKVMPTVREADGLAMSSRNNRLSKNERLESPILYQSLQNTKILISQGHRKVSALKNSVRKMIKRNSQAKVEYIEFVKRDDLTPLNYLKGQVLIALAVWFGKTRLIDNITVNVR